MIENNKKSNNKMIWGKDGFTLIEVIVSLFIISILSILLIGSFDINTRQIFGAGEKTDILFSARREMDNAIADSNYVVSADSRLTISKQKRDIIIGGAQVSGVEIQVKQKSNGKVVLTSFIPE
ncbi:MAG: prepilin-type N-terminal cleavage/methylation domain-containing protein [Clostridia bacterium]|nr:prepilin-type N-terminal cleavage/methylation domain-containing protein [Clostridia bacterium]